MSGGVSGCAYTLQPSPPPSPASHTHTHTHTHTTNHQGFLGSKRVMLPVIITGELVGAADFIYLAYIMAYVLNDTCLVCIALYSLHFLLIVLHVYQYCNTMNYEKQNKKTK